MSEIKKFSDLHRVAFGDCEKFVAELQKLGVKLPLYAAAQDSEDLGVIFDADGNGVLTVDVNSEMDDVHVVVIAEWVAMAVNTCGGFMAVPSPKAMG